MMTDGTSLTGESMLDDSNCSDISDASKFAASSNTFNGTRSLFAAAGAGGGGGGGHLSWSSVLHPSSSMQQAASHHAAEHSSSAITSIGNGGHHLLAHHSSFKSESDENECASVSQTITPHQATKSTKGRKSSGRKPASTREERVSCLCNGLKKSSLSSSSY